MLASRGLSVKFACSSSFLQKMDLKGFLVSGKTFYSLADWAAHIKTARNFMTRNTVWLLSVNLIRSTGPS